MEQNVKLSGFIIGTTEPVLFICDSFGFVFLINRIEDVFDETGIELIPDENGYLHGYTHNGHHIYIYIKRNLKVQSKLNFHTSKYFVSIKNLEDYDFRSFHGMRFENGTLLKIFRPRATEMERIEGGIKTTIVNDRRNYQIISNGKASRMTIFSDTIERHSFEEGSSIRNDTVKLDVIFEEALPISNIDDVYKSIVALCRLMTGRKNISFNKISLLLEIDDIDVNPYPAIICYLESNSVTPTSRPSHECIQFSEIDSEIEKILNLISLKGHTAPCVWMEFLTSDDSRPFWVTDTRIREIVTAFEGAAKLVKIQVIIDKEIDRFKKYLNKMVNEHKKSPEMLHDLSIYDKLLSSLGNWMSSTGALIISANKKYANALDKIAIPKEFRLNDEGIHAFVAHRNVTSHGKAGEISNQKIFATFQVMALTYCCILEAAGIPHDKIEKIMQKGIFKPY